MERESCRTDYIDKLYENKNIKWLQKELNLINSIVNNYLKNLSITSLQCEKEKYEKNLKYEKEIRTKIQKYLYDLLGK